MTIKRKEAPPDLFIRLPLAMIDSPAFHVLNKWEIRALLLLDIKYVRNRMRDNGQIPLTWDEAAAFGVRRNGIAASHRTLEALRFTCITERGFAGLGNQRTPNRFLLTWRPTDDPNTGRQIPPTNDWQSIRTKGEAQAIANAARASKPTHIWRYSSKNVVVLKPKRK